MPGRGGNRGRGRGTNFKNTTPRLESVRDRLGVRVPNYQGPNDRAPSRKYKFVRASTITIATVPQEPKIKLLTRKFLKSYYEIFDQPGRANLESQYNQEAFFSFSSTSEAPNYGRNLLKVTDPMEANQKLLYSKTAIADTLRLFPPTEHMVDYLSYDVPYYIVNPMSVSLMHIVVTGVFKDTSLEKNPLKSFTRVFLLKQVSTEDQGEPVYEIFNDLFMLQPPTGEQVRRFHLDYQLTKKLTPDQPHRNLQESMLQSIMTKTKMNKENSRNLLAEVQWNENRAMEVFENLKNANKIPQEFFIP